MPGPRELVRESPHYEPVEPLQSVRTHEELLCPLCRRGPLLGRRSDFAGMPGQASSAGLGAAAAGPGRPGRPLAAQGGATAGGDRSSVSGGINRPAPGGNDWVAGGLFQDQ